MSTRQRVLVTGKHGFIGQHVVHWLGVMNHVVVDTLEDGPSAMIALAWRGLPNYESKKHYENVEWQAAQIRDAYQQGVTNITVVGTCLEEVPCPPHYALAKLALLNLLSDLPIKWVRMFYLYGVGQREECLLPRLKAAIKRGDKTFSVIDGERDFMDVRDASMHLCHIAEQTEVTGIIDCCTGVATPVADFCRQKVSEMLPKASIQIVANYPIPSYEPVTFCGNPEKLRSIR